MTDDSPTPMPCRMLRFLPFTLIVLLTGCAEDSTKNNLRVVAMENDPATLALERGYNTYIRRTFLKDRTETGIIDLKDGSSSKYWFRSHHLSHDIGGTWFRMSDGQEVYMAGYFCCEVQLPEEQLGSLAALRDFINEHDGVAP